MPGPISDVIPSTPIFEMYPVGFSSISEYLRKRGYTVRIVNLAYLMLKDEGFDAEKNIRKLKPRAFGIDLHWLPHAQGSLEVAEICKKYHPEIPVIFGGYSSSYFHKELMNYPQVDFVIRGDSAEESIYKLLLAIAGRMSLSEVPNLTFRGKEGVRVNPLTIVSQDLNEFSNDYLGLFRSALRFLDIQGFTAIHDWWEYPITAVMTCRGCTQSCVICGGSQQALRLYCGRERPAFRNPQLVVKDIEKVRRYTDAPIFVVGDLRQGGEDYAHQILKGIREIRPENHIVLELFGPALPPYLEETARSIPNLNFELSPESHDQMVREASGKFYTNQEMEECIRIALDSGCKKFDLFYMIGIPRQTYHSVMENVEYCDYLLTSFDKRLSTFISPLAPFIDPGSIAYEQADFLGYRIFYHTLEEYRQALLAPSWKYTLSYETQWMNRAEIVESTYQAALRLNRIKRNHGVISEEVFQTMESRIKKAVQMMGEIDEILRNFQGKEREERLLKLKGEVGKDECSTLCEKGEIKWPAGKRRIKYFNVINDLLAS
jgi:B12-binding domain/radical SAM domain protein